MRIGLKTKLKKLEGKANMQFGTRLAVEYECDASGMPVEAFVRDWLLGVAPARKTQQRADLAPFRPIFARKVIAAPTFASDAAWEAACLVQQRELSAVCHSRTNEPANTAPVIVGNSFEDDAPAPKQGTKGRRFVELADGRTFDTETRRYVDEDRKPIAKAGGLSAKWNG